MNVQKLSFMFVMFVTNKVHWTWYVVRMRDFNKIRFTTACFALPFSFFNHKAQGFLNT